MLARLRFWDDDDVVLYVDEVREITYIDTLPERIRVLSTRGDLYYPKEVIFTTK